MTDLIEQVRELNEKRTQGNWKVIPHPDISSGGYYQIGLMGKTEMSYVFTYQDKNVMDINAQFIALSPAMAEALLEQTRQLQIALQALSMHHQWQLKAKLKTGFCAYEDSEICSIIEKALREMEGGND